MSSQQFQDTYLKIFELSNKLLGFIKEYRQGKLSEGDNTQALSSVEKDIETAIDGLRNQKYEVAIVAPMKAGKSTFLNAIIGADILASESAACTICRTDVRHIKAGEKACLWEYRDDGRKFLVAEGDAHEIQEKFLERTREIRTYSNDNPEMPSRFELLYPIEAIENLPALSGFTLIDTPGPNEWKSMSVDTVALKQVSLEALRTCKAVLFILNYRSFKDKAVDELFQSITENRKELLLSNKNRIFFILNQVDLKSERDPEIIETINFLRKELVSFGFSDPIIYPVSALQGLLGKLIKRGTATEKQIKDFKRFFSARYAQENEDGDMVTPAPKKIAPQAVEDSGILEVQEAVFQTVVETSGWILLNDALELLDGSAKSTEDSLNTQIAGWEMEIDRLRNKIKEYEIKANSARTKVESVRESINRQKKILLDGFSAGIDAFTEAAKEKIQGEIDSIATSRSSRQNIKRVIFPPAPEVAEQKIQKEIDSIVTSQSSGQNFKQVTFPPVSMEKKMTDDNFLTGLFKIGTVFVGNMLESIPGIGRAMAQTFRVSVPLLENLRSSVPEVFKTEIESNPNPYVIRCDDRREADRVKETINSFCAPHLQSWWLDTQDQLIRQGTDIREKLVQNIREDIQVISNELSSYLGDALEVEINMNAIHFPSFEFKGIDAQVRYQQQVYQRSQKEERRKSRCCNSDKVYYVDVPVTETRTFYEIDLRDTSSQIQARLEEQSSINKALIQRVIDKQINDDFKKAQTQIDDYISKFQTEFEELLSKRVKYEADSPKIVEALKENKRILQQYKQELDSLKSLLDNCKSL